jgi:hypothetical protein
VKGCETLRILILGIYSYILIEESEPGIAIPEKNNDGGIRPEI